MPFPACWVSSRVALADNGLLRAHWLSTLLGTMIAVTDYKALHLLQFLSLQQRLYSLKFYVISIYHGRAILMPVFEVQGEELAYHKLRYTIGVFWSQFLEPYPC